MSEDNSTWWDNARLYMHQRKPFGEKHTLADASYKLEDRGPHDNDFSGAPKYLWFWPIVFIAGLYFAYWFWYGWVQEPVFIDWELLENLTWVAIAALCFLTIGFVSIFIDMHKGISSAYKYFILLTIRFMDRRDLIREELRVKKSIELWNPHDKEGAWEDVELIEESIRATEKGKADLEKANTDTDKKIAEILEAVKAIIPTDIGTPTEEKDKDEILGDFIVAGKRFSSVRDMRNIMTSIYGKIALPEGRDHIAEILELRRRFVRIATALEIPFFVTLLLCERDISPLVMSNLPLFGGADEGKSEFTLHTLAIRSWAAYAARTVHNVAVGSCIQVAEYPHYVMNRSELAMTGRKDEKLKFAPIFYITDSDGQTSDIIKDIRHKKNKHTPDATDIIQGDLVYKQSVADELFERNKLISGRLDRKTKSEAEIRRDADADAKATIARGLDISLRTGQVRGWRSGIINLFSSKAAKFLMYTMFLLMTFFFISWLAYNYAGVSVPWFEGGNSTAPGEDDDSWGVVKLLWEVSRTL